MGNRVLFAVAAAAAAVLVYVALAGGRTGPERGARPAPEVPGEEAAVPADLPRLPDSAPPPEGGTADLTVLVVDEANAPVAGARVSAAQRTAETGADGTVAFPGLAPAGKLAVRATGSPTQVPATGQVELVSNRHADLKLVLVAGGGITGTVLGKGGAPLAGGYKVFVLEVPPGMRANPAMVQLGGREVTSRSFPAGTAVFSIDGVPAGNYVARASAEGCVDRASEPFEVRKGAITDGVTIALDPGGRITGVVVRARTGEPVPGAEVSARRADGDRMAFVAGSGRGTGFRVMGEKSGKSNAQGAFVIDGVEPGTYVVEATTGDLASARVEGVEVREEGEAAGIMLSLGEGGTLTGRVFGTDGKPLPGAEVLVARIQKGVMIIGDVGDRVKCNEEGVYTVEHLDPGVYKVSRPGASGGAMAVSMTMVVTGGPKDEPEEEETPPGTVTVREGQVTRFDLVAAQRGAIRGRLLDEDGKPLRENVGLTEISTEEEEDAAPGIRFGFPNLTRPDENGNFEFRDLKAGRYSVECAGTTEEVVVALGETAEVILKVTPATVEGVVLNSAGDPVKAAGVFLEPVEQQQGFGFGNLFRQDRTLEDGKFAMKGVAPGRYRVVANGPKGEGRSEEFAVGRGEKVAGIRVVIEEAVEVRVEVRDAAGQPVANAFVSLRREGGGVVMGGRAAQTNEEGIAVLQAAPGEWTLSATLPADPPKTAERSISITAGGAQDFTLRLE